MDGVQGPKLRGLGLCRAIENQENYGKPCECHSEIAGVTVPCAANTYRAAIYDRNKLP